MDANDNVNAEAPKRVCRAAFEQSSSLLCAKTPAVVFHLASSFLDTKSHCALLSGSRYARCQAGVAGAHPFDLVIDVDKFGCRNATVPAALTSAASLLPLSVAADRFIGFGSARYAGRTDR
jgi:hypothetical protein